MNTLYYIHDPMCSWCYAFVPTWRRLLAQLPDGVNVERLLGGLAPDTDQPMPLEMRERLQESWRQIERSVPGTRFNFDFWHKAQPRRSTYPSCRAVLAAREQGDEYDVPITHAIQRAYYQEARNPSDNETLIALAGEIGLEPAQFETDLLSLEIRHDLEAEIAQARHLGGHSFPSLVLDAGGSRWPIAINYTDHSAMLETIEELVAE